MGTKLILSLSLIAVLLIGAVSFDDAYAAKGDPKEPKDKKPNVKAIFGDPDFAIFGDPDVAEIFGDPDFDALFGDPDFMIQSLQDADDDLQSQIDSFFDVFFGTESHTGDSFFDIFTNVEPGGTTTTPDSFFDVFVEIDERDQHFDTEILSMDLRGQSCNVGDVVTGVGADGNLLCEPDATGISQPPQIHKIVQITTLTNELKDITPRQNCPVDTIPLQTLYTTFPDKMPISIGNLWYQPGFVHGPDQPIQYTIQIGNVKLVEPVSAPVQASFITLCITAERSD
jgi:hypothetical protein